MSAHAELVIHNGTIHTLDATTPHAEAVAIRAGKILAVGSLEEIENLTHANTRRIDLAGRTLIPAFNDAHLHLWKLGLLLTTMLDARPAATPSITAIVEAFRSRAAHTPAGTWITGRGYHEDNLPEKRHPTRHELDQASTDHPLHLIHTSAHAAVVNTKALQLAGITRDTPNPAGGEIVRDEHGEPTGLLLETAMSRISAIQPPPSTTEFEDAVIAGARACLRLGITSITEAGVAPDQLDVYRALKTERKLPIRANVMALRYKSDGTKCPLPGRYESEWLRIDTVKLFADGGLSSATAAVSEPYRHAPANAPKGLPRYTDEQMTALIWDIHRAGLRAAVHAIGDVAIEQVLSAVEFAQSRLASRLRHRIEHFGLPNADHLRRARYRVSVVPQTVFIHALGDSFLKFVPKKLAQQIYPLRSMLDAGLTVALSSDSPVVPDLNPLLGMRAAADRLSENESAVCPEQAVSIAETLPLYTLGGAIVAGEETLKGTITPGKLADFAVLSGDPFRAPIDRLTDLHVEMTICDGQVVYEL
jgi:predicted amidohydrolase YtcJ